MNGQFQAKKVLFLCTHNSARSQMAEGLLRDQHGEQYDVFSAGTVATRVHPLACLVMEEIGIDISNHSSKTPPTQQDHSKIVGHPSENRETRSEAGSTLNLGPPDSRM